MGSPDCVPLKHYGQSNWVETTVRKIRHLIRRVLSVVYTSCLFPAFRIVAISPYFSFGIHFPLYFPTLDCPFSVKFGEEQFPVLFIYSLQNCVSFYHISLHSTYHCIAAFSSAGWNPSWFNPSTVGSCCIPEVFLVEVSTLNSLSQSTEDQSCT